MTAQLTLALKVTSRALEVGHYQTLLLFVLPAIRDYGLYLVIRSAFLPRLRIACPLTGSRWDVAAPRTGLHGSPTLLTILQISSNTWTFL